MPLKIGWLLVGCLAAIAAPAASEVELPPGAKLGSGAIDDDGQVFFTVSGENGSFLVRQAGERREIFELPNTRVVGRVRLLEDGRLLLGRSKIVKPRAGKVVTVWSWEQPDCPDGYRDMHGCAREGFEPPLVSGDGKMWGVAGLDGPTRARFTFGRTRKGRKSARAEVVDFGAPYNGDFELVFRFLDSEGQVVMVPYWTWKGDAFIVHFSDGGSPYTVPVFLGEGDGASALYWQRGDRLLWASSPTGVGRWRAYHLWDFGLSGLPDEPSWELEAKDGWRPHPERGVVRVAEGKRGYRIEHLWREPWTGLEEHHVSDWQPGPAPATALGYGWLVSPNGRHAAVIETRQLEDEEGGGVAFSARSVDMLREPRPLTPVEASAPPADDAEPDKNGAPPSS